MSRKGSVVSEETRLKMRQAQLGPKNHRFGKRHTPETKKKMSDSMKGKLVGEKHPMWKGGISRMSYSEHWTKTLKRSIRERDNYMCRLCGNPQTDIAHDVHHIDYDKKNSDPKNLVTLCKSCHMKTNVDRHKWQKFFQTLFTE